MMAFEIGVHYMEWAEAVARSAHEGPGCLSAPVGWQANRAIETPPPHRSLDGCGGACKPRHQEGAAR